MGVTTLDGRAFSKFVAAGTYFLKKYQGVLNDLNVYPVPDGDTGSNMYLTSKAALQAATKVKDQSLSVVADAAAHASLLGARGNSGVIFSQMFRGFAEHVRDRGEIGTRDLGRAMAEAVKVARAALLRPVEGTILSVASAAAEAASTGSAREDDFLTLAGAMLEAANEALERTPEQLPLLKEAGVVDSGGAGFVYFIEGILRFTPGRRTHESAFTRRTTHSHVFAARPQAREHRFCTEFVLEDAKLEAAELRALLEPFGSSLIVAGARPELKVHLHTDRPDQARSAATRHGTVTRYKAEDMAAQHRDRQARARRAAAVVFIAPGEGYAHLAADLGADVVAAPSGGNPSVAQLLAGIEGARAEVVYVLANDPNVVLAAREAVTLANGTRGVVVPTRDPAQGIAALIAAGPKPASGLTPESVLEAISGVRTAEVYFAGKDCLIGGTAVRRGAPTCTVGGVVRTAPALAALIASLAGEFGAENGGLLTLYYGGSQSETDAQRIAALVGERFGALTIETYFGGAPALEYTIAFEH